MPDLKRSDTLPNLPGWPDYFKGRLQYSLKQKGVPDMSRLIERLKSHRINPDLQNECWAVFELYLNDSKQAISKPQIRIQKKRLNQAWAYYSLEEQTIYARNLKTDAMTRDTILHEMAHHIEYQEAGGKGQKKCYQKNQRKHSPRFFCIWYCLRRMAEMLGTEIDSSGSKFRDIWKQIDAARREGMTDADVYEILDPELTYRRKAAARERLSERVNSDKVGRCNQVSRKDQDQRE